MNDTSNILPMQSVLQFENQSSNFSTLNALVPNKNKLLELKEIFPDISNERALELLKSNNYDIEKCLDAAFQIMNEINTLNGEEENKKLATSVITKTNSEGKESKFTKTNSEGKESKGTNSRGTKTILPKSFLQSPHFRTVITNKKDSTITFTVIFRNQHKKIGFTIWVQNYEVLIRSINSNTSHAQHDLQYSLSLAQEAKLNIGDVLIGINSEAFGPTTEVQDVLEIIDFSGSTLQMNFIRKGVVKPINIHDCHPAVKLLKEQNVINKTQILFINKLINHLKDRILNWNYQKIKYRLTHWKVIDRIVNDYYVMQPANNSNTPSIKPSSESWLFGSSGKHFSDKKTDPIINTTNRSEPLAMLNTVDPHLGVSSSVQFINPQFDVRNRYDIRNVSVEQLNGNYGSETLRSTDSTTGSQISESNLTIDTNISNLDHSNDNRANYRTMETDIPHSLRPGLSIKIIRAVDVKEKKNPNQMERRASTSSMSFSFSSSSSSSSQHQKLNNSPHCTWYEIWVMDVRTGLEWTVYRRFREFFDFREKLLKVRKHTIEKFEFPNKRMKGMETPIVVEERVRLLQKFLGSLQSLLCVDSLHPSTMQMEYLLQLFVDLRTYREAEIIKRENRLSCEELALQDVQVYTYSVLQMSVMGKVLDGFMDTFVEDNHLYSENKLWTVEMVSTLLEDVNNFFDSLQSILSDGFMATCISIYEQLDLKANGSDSKNKRILSSNQLEDKNSIQSMEKNTWQDLSAKNEEEIKRTINLKNPILSVIRKQIEVEAFVPISLLVQSVVQKAFRTQQSQLQIRLIELIPQPQSFFGIPLNHISPSSWEHIVYLFRGLQSIQLPTDRISNLVSLAKQIPYLFKVEHPNDESTLGADDLLPIFIYVLVKAQIPDLFAFNQMLQLLCDSNRRLSEEGYYLATLEASIYHIYNDEVNVDGLGSNGRTSSLTLLGTPMAAAIGVSDSSKGSRVSEHRSELLSSLVLPDSQSARLQRIQWLTSKVLDEENRENNVLFSPTSAAIQSGEMTESRQPMSLGRYLDNEVIETETDQNEQGTHEQSTKSMEIMSLDDDNRMIKSQSMQHLPVTVNTSPVYRMKNLRRPQSLTRIPVSVSSVVHPLLDQEQLM